MTHSPTHLALAEKFAFKNIFDKTMVGDSLIALVEFAYTEEEAQVVNALGFAPMPARAVARRLKRPVGEVRPILASLADRLLIMGMNVKGVQVYTFLAMLPGVFELQMLRSRNPGMDTAWFAEFSRLFEDTYDEYMRWIAPMTEGRDLRFGRIIPIEKSLDAAQGILPWPTDRFSEILERNKSFCLMNVCACRQGMELIDQGCGRGMEACSAMGWLADIAISKGLGRRVSREEFFEAKMRAADQGLVNMVDNLKDPMQVCACCTCCCAALRMLKTYNIPTVIVGSHFEAAIDPGACKGCESCAKKCPMDAITVTEKIAQVDYTRCIGCGVCVAACDKEHAIRLKERPGHKAPSSNLAAFLSERTLEMQGREHGLVQGLSMDLANLFFKVSPFDISGPKYRGKP